ncbi:hypothetical protein ES707_09146 [subsurface metagenome]
MSKPEESKESKDELLKEVKQLKEEQQKEHSRTSTVRIVVGLMMIALAFILWRCGASIGLFD